MTEYSLNYCDFSSSSSSNWRLDFALYRKSTQPICGNLCVVDRLLSLLSDEPNAEAECERCLTLARITIFFEKKSLIEIIL